MQANETGRPRFRTIRTVLLQAYQHGHDYLD